MARKWVISISVVLLACTAAPSSLAEGPAVSQLVLIDPQGDVGAVVAMQQRGRAIAQGHNLKGKGRVLHATVAGAQSGFIGIGIEYPDMESLMQAVATMEADPEAQKLATENAGKLRVLSRSIWTEIKPAANPATAPGAVQTILVDPQGNVSDFLAMHDKVEAVSKRLKLKGSARVLQATIAGNQSQVVAVIVEYPDIATLGKEIAELEGNPEFQAIAQENAGKFRFVSRGMWRDITPE